MYHHRTLTTSAQKDQKYPIKEIPLPFPEPRPIPVSPRLFVD